MNNPALHLPSLRSVLRPVKSLGAIAGFAALLSAGPAIAAEKDDAALLNRLKDSKHSLAAGIAQSEEANGAVISAKFEMKGDTLMLSVYTARGGIGKDAEHNELIELLGDATQGT